MGFNEPPRKGSTRSGTSPWDLRQVEATWLHTERCSENMVRTGDLFSEEPPTYKEAELLNRTAM